jgi:hypothetical protein
MAFSRNLLIVFLLWFISGCSSTDERADLEVSRTVSGFNFKVSPKFQPNENQKEGQAQSDFLEIILKIRPETGDEDIVRYKAASLQEIQLRKYYFSYSFQNDISLEVNGVMIPCQFLHFEQADLGITKTFILGFSMENIPAGIQQATLVLKSSYFGSLPIKILFRLS